MHLQQHIRLVCFLFSSLHKTKQGPCFPGLLTFAGARRSTSTPFNYTVFFTNDSAFATFYLENSKGAITLHFNGSRVDHYDGTSNVYKGHLRDATIELNTTDPSKPGFQWSNGDHISLNGEHVKQPSEAAGKDRTWCRALAAYLIVGLTLYTSL